MGPGAALVAAALAMASAQPGLGRPRAWCARVAMQPCGAVIRGHSCYPREPGHHRLAAATHVRTFALTASAAASKPAPASGHGDGRERRKLRHLRALVLTLLVAQNAASALLARWTRVRRPGVPMYLDSAAVLVTELSKVPMCLAMMLATLGPGGFWQDLKDGFSKPLDVLKLAVPALCYTLQNILFYVALSHLSASAYQVLSQTKTLATAGFWVTIFGGRLVFRQWVALTLLVAGVSAVQLDSVSAAVAHGNELVGVGAVLASSMLSGFANVYFEKLVKTTPTSIWVRNLQLAFFTVPQSLLFMAKDSAAVAMGGALRGFTMAVWAVVLLKAVGGLIVASTVKYADSLLKSFATAISIILTCLLSIPMYGIVPSARFAQGVAGVIVSVFMYNVRQQPQAAPLPPSAAPPPIGNRAVAEVEGNGEAKPAEAED